LLFFSSRRRHTRFSRDWSTDVCSSDLGNRAGRLRHLADVPLKDIAAFRFLLHALTSAKINAEFAAALLERVRHLLANLVVIGNRSEERRVGKESSTGTGTGRGEAMRLR